jgi:peptide/nickel transport system ATP-binding protein
LKNESLLRVEDLKIEFPAGQDYKTVVQGLNFNLGPKTILGIVGESGSGKSVSCMSLMGLLPKTTRITGKITFQGQSLLNLSEQDWEGIRAARIGMIFQEPMTSLNPSLKCGFQVAEVFKKHSDLKENQIKEAVIELFKKVKLPRPDKIYDAYPHEISGGQKQRVVIAMAIACKPRLIIADEPTTALDVTVQKEILKLLKEIQEQEDVSIIFISHDLSLVAEFVDEILVMYKGEVMEQGPAKKIFTKPEHPYTRALIASKPSLKERLIKLPSVKDFLKGSFKAVKESKKERKSRLEDLYAKKPLLEVKNLKTYFRKHYWLKEDELVKAVDDVSFKVYPGETLGLVGESGCGKSTLGRSIMNLERPEEGQILFNGQDLTKLKGSALKAMRKDVQLIYQDPYSSLNPRMTIGKAIEEPMRVHGLVKGGDKRKARAISLLQKVGLEAEHYDRYPHEFSGGQRQRVGIARCLALEPKLIICDESVSALDVSVQAQVLNLLNALKKDFGFTYIFISHDLAVVKYMSDQLMVMNKGKMEELGDADSIYVKPKSKYTEKLIDSIPKGL